MAIVASVRSAQSRAVRLSCIVVAYSLLVAMSSAIMESSSHAQETGRRGFDNLFSDKLDSGQRHSKPKRDSSVAADRRVQRANWTPDSPTRFDQVGDSQTSLERLAKIANADPSPLARETARLQLIERQFSDDYPGSPEKESDPLQQDDLPPKGQPPFQTAPSQIRRIGFNSTTDFSDSSFPPASDDGISSTAPFSESDDSIEWFQDPAAFPVEKEHAFQLIKAEHEDDQPDVLRSPFPAIVEDDEFLPRSPDATGVTRTVFDAPLGFTGPSSVLPSEVQESDHFVPVEDRWRVGFPEWDRYGKGNPDVDDQPYETGHWWDPYNQNVLKGDYPVIGQHTFLNITATNEMLNEFREVPTGTTPFESTVGPNQQEFFGNPRQYLFANNLRLQFNLSHGDTAFKPFDWQVRLTPVFNLNYLSVKELGVVNPDVRAGTKRFRDDVAFEEWFVEAKLADLSPNYDFASVRAGSQLFVSDFRGFIFSDTNRAVRLFGTRLSNRDQFNLIFFDQSEKDTNSGLNTFRDRNQNTLIANYFRQDFVIPGFTTQFSFHYNNDGPSTEYDRNSFLVRPDPVGVFREHRVEAYYFGVAGDGHVGRVNVNHAFYHVEGTDSMNPIQGQKSQIRANMAALELSIDRDWVRFRTSYFWASGDDNPNDCKATGFDSIFDNPNFAGGQFSYWQRQSIKLFGVNLVQRESLIPDLRSSKTQGQSNFVNPGLHLLNGGMDFELTPKLKAITNANLLWFDKTQTLERLVYQNNIRHSIGTDLSVGMEYRPLLSDNVIVVGGVSTLIPGKGFDDLFGVTDPFTTANAQPGKADTLRAMFLNLIMTY